MTEQFFMLNHNFNYKIIDEKIFVEHNQKQIILHGNQTSNILIPNFKKLFHPFSLEKIAGKKNYDFFEIANLFNELIKKNIVIELESDFLSNTLNHSTFFLNTEEKINIVIFTNFYMSQFLILKETFSKNKNISFTFVFDNIDENLFQKQIKPQIEGTNCKVALFHNNLNEVFEKCKYSLIISTMFDFNYSLKKMHINYRLNACSLKYNIPIIFTKIDTSSYLLGPTFIPNKTASFIDLIKNKIQVPINEHENFFINPSLAGMLVYVIVNEVNWILFNVNTPLLINHVVYSSKSRLENKRSKIYIYY